MLVFILAAVAALGPGSTFPDLDPDQLPFPGSSPPELLASGGRSSAPCEGREGWVGDGDDGRAPPACDDDPDPESRPDPAGLHEPDWLQRDEDGASDDGGAQLR